MGASVRKNSKRFIAAAMSAVMVMGIPQPTLAAEQQRGIQVNTIKVNPTIQYQTMEGWGTSLCWFTNIIGGWTEDYDGNGRADREDIAELLYSPEYLNMNVVRYNIGGGDNPEHSHIKRAEAKMPGWKSGPDAPLNPQADENQMWFLEKANEYHGENTINEVFSNSPPYYMTNSNCSTGNFNSNTNNLKDDSYDDFAQYLAEVTQYLDGRLQEKYGTGIDYIDPINEPDTSYWGAGSTKQEGCHFDPGYSQSRIFTEMGDALKERGLSNVLLTGTDETSVDHAIGSFNQLSMEVKQNLATISTHTYGANNREVLSDLAASYDKGLWMSEVCHGGGPHNPDSMEATSAPGFSDSIMADLKTMQPTAWIDWQVVDSEYECLKHNENWGLIHAVFEEDGPVNDYHTNLVDEGGNALPNVPGYGEWHITKQFYTLMQYSKFLKAGYTMIDIDNNGMAAAISPDKSELVIVSANSGNSGKRDYLDLSMFSNLGTVDTYRTSDTENCEEVSNSGINGSLLTVDSPAKSVSTYVIQGEGNLVTEDASITRVNSGVVTNDNTIEAQASPLGKFAYTGSWSRYTGQGSAYQADVWATNEIGAATTFTFNSNRAILTGNMQPEGGRISYVVDHDPPVEIDTYAAEMQHNKVLVDTGELEPGEHTITLTMLGGSTGNSPNPVISVDEAKIYKGTMSDMAVVPVVTGLTAMDSAVQVNFNDVADASGYTVRIGDSKDTSTWNPDHKVSASTGPITVTGLENGKSYYFTVEANIEEQTAKPSRAYMAIPKANESGYLYLVNAGVKNPYDTSEYMLGALQSSFEQEYGVDSVTGKSWGYDSEIPSGGNGASGLWESVRTDNLNKVGEGLGYYFELPKGQYIVEIGAFDPWGNQGRYEDLVVQGETIAKGVRPADRVAVKCISEVSDDQKLTVQALRSQGNAGANEDTLLSYIKIKAYDGNEIMKAESPSPIRTDPDTPPTLPQTAVVVKADGSRESARVEWNVDTSAFSQRYDTVKVNGKVKGTEVEVSIDVYVAGELQYFIDSGTTDKASEEYQLVSALYPKLKNKVSDQSYKNQEWGYVSEGAVVTGEGDKYNTGLYAQTNKDLIYKIPLKKGNYGITAGFHEWWGQIRGMQVIAEYTEEGKAVALSNTQVEISGSKSSADANLSFYLPKDAEVTLRVKKSGSNDPVISWIGVEEVKDIPAEVTGTIPSTAVTVGQQPELQKSVEVRTLSGESASAEIKWDSLSASSVRKPYTSFVVKGRVSNSDLWVSTRIEVIPENLVYFIDSGSQNTQSPSYDAVKAAGAPIKNQAPDQKYDGSGWGVTADYAGFKNDGQKDKFLSGYYGKNASGKEQGFSYKLTLDKGSYNMTVQSHEWWSGPRTTIFEAVYEDADGGKVSKFIGDKVSVSSSNRNAMTSGTLNITQDNTLVTLHIYGQTHEAAVITFLGVHKTGEYKPDRLEITPPTKLIYEFEEAIDLKGLEVTAFYPDGMSRKVPQASCQIHGYQKDKSGEQTVTVSYEGLEGTFKVTVKEKTETEPGKDPEPDTNPIPDKKPEPDKKPDTEKPGNTIPVFGKVTGLRGKSASYNRAQLMWKKVSGADGYEVYRSTNKNSKYKIAGTLKKNTAVTFTNKNLTTGKTYYYKIRAYRVKSGKKEYAAYSSAVKVRPVPAATTVSLKRLSSKKLNIRWKAVSGASGYQVQYSTKAKTGFQDAGRVKGKHKISYTKDKLKSKKTYYVRVRAYRTVQGKMIYAGWSKVKSMKLK